MRDALSPQGNASKGDCIHLFCSLLLFCGEGEGVETHLLQHRGEAVAAGGGEVLAEIDGINEVEVGIDDVMGRVTAQHTYQQSDDALDKDGIGVAVVDDNGFTVSGLGLPQLCSKPDFGLAAVDEILFGAVGIGERFETIAVVDEQAVAVHPIVESTKFIDNLALYFVDGS